MLLSLRNFSHPVPMNSRAASSRRIDAAGNRARWRVISATRAPVALLPGPSIIVQISGTRKRRVTTASTR